MMRSRTIREGSVGLLILLGLMAFSGLVLWLRGLNVGSKPYMVNVDFETTAGMQPGAPVRYRGVVVGRVNRIEPGSNAARVVIEIYSTELVIPRDLIVEANQVGLIGETSIDLVPQSSVPRVALEINPRSKDCDSSLILCDGMIVNGEVGVSYDTLIRTTAKLADRLDNPELIEEIKTLVTNTSAAAAGIATLSGEVTDLTSSFQEDIRFLTRSIEEDLGTLSTAATTTVNSVAGAASELELTATQLNGLLAENRSSLATTLTNLDVISADVRRMVNVLTPVLESGELVANLETLSTNAAIASENLRVASGAFSNADTLVQLQQTLDSAHETFENARKITADLDELTGDPQFRQQIRELVDGFSSLVSTTEQLEHQTAIAQALNQAAIAPSPHGSSPSRLSGNIDAQF
ncbi:MAG: MlaD family protein [Leptolyngbyaceae bacterium]|nr:MlaD family protein [Leptolyngbyaceae bacterium]